MSLIGSCLTFPSEEMYRQVTRVLVNLGRTQKLTSSFCSNYDDL